MPRLICVLLLLLPLLSYAAEPAQANLDAVAQSYVKLVLALGQHDPDYVDAYYGPAEWKTAAEKAGKRPLTELRAEAEKLLAALERTPVPQEEMLRLRRSYLKKQLASLGARVEMLEGKKFTFDEEARRLYDAAPPHYSEEHFQQLAQELDKLLPGKGLLGERLSAYRRNFVVPHGRLEKVFAAAIQGCRERTARHIRLPEGESFTVEYVKDKPWGGYNWYQGGYRSVIQVNTDLPSYIGGALQLACHEGYPGHHVYNALLEQHLVKGRGWVEFSVYPLYSPQSLVAEGTGNYGLDVAFPEVERLEFEKKVLFPLAGLDPAAADRYARVGDAAEKLEFATSEAARRYLDGKLDADGTVDWLVKYALMTPDRARKYLSFIARYRSYVINYNYGKRLVREYVEAQAGGDPQRRWQVFERLLASPRLPSDLLEGARAAAPASARK